MAKNFPYFKFTVSEWMTGDIVFESLSTQGLFINICALYWQRDGNLSIEDINKRYKNPVELLNLINTFVEVENDIISIKFLDEQLIDANHVSKVNSANGKKSAESRATAKRLLNDRSTTAQRISTKKNKNKNEIRIKEEENKNYIDSSFLEIFNKWMDYKKERKESYKTEMSKKSFYNSLIKFSNNNPIIANEIIEQSISNNYAGIFELKNKITTPNGNKAANGMVY